VCINNDTKETDPIVFLCRLQEKILRIFLNWVWSQTFSLHALQRKGISVHLLQILFTSSLKPLACCDGTNETTNLSVYSWSSRRALNKIRMSSLHRSGKRTQTMFPLSYPMNTVSIPLWHWKTDGYILAAPPPRNGFGWWMAVTSGQPLLSIGGSQGIKTLSSK
jgi:hypothetical protein